MIEEEKEILKVFEFKKWQQNNKIRHCYSKKHGGVSTGVLESLNLGFNRGDLKENVIENYQRVATYLHTVLDDMVLSNQVHETQIKKVTSKHKGNGILKVNEWSSCDGLYTTEKGITLVTHYADCVPLFFYSPEKGGIIGVAHAGWRGTVEEIGVEMVKQWTQNEGISVESIEVGIGPSIGPCCFEVHNDVCDAFKQKFGNNVPWIQALPNHKFTIDLWECNRQSLLKVGVLKEHIESAKECTCCQSNVYYSHRKTQGKRGTAGAFMQLVEEK